MKFRQVASFSSVLFLGLAAVWLFAPDLMLAQWGVQASGGTDFIGRRAAAFYAGIGVMLWLVRHEAASKARSAMVAGVSLACFLLAVLGISEWLHGVATANILAAVLLEILLAFALLRANSVK